MKMLDYSDPLIKIKQLTASMEEALLRGDFDAVPAILDKLEAEHGRMEYALYCREKSNNKPKKH